jgi:hypothetical protein
MKDKIGVWAFIGGLILATIIALFSASSTPAWAVTLIAVLGLIVGFLNVSKDEIQMYLIASIAFLLSFQSLNAVTSLLPASISSIASAFFTLMGAFIAPGAAVTAILAIYHIAKN